MSEALHDAVDRFLGGFFFFLGGGEGHTSGGVDLLGRWGGPQVPFGVFGVSCI